LKQSGVSKKSSDKKYIAFSLTGFAVRTGAIVPCILLGLEEIPADEVNLTPSLLR
jgi:hypothetical protein